MRGAMRRDGAGAHVVRRAALAASVPVAAHVSPIAASRSSAVRRLLGIRECTKAGGVALTFDDGPHPKGTLAALEALRGAGARATFFVVGENAARWPSLTREIVAAGHEVALHGHRHRLLLRLTPRQLAEDISRGAAAVEDATDRTPRLYRPPYGVYSASALRTLRRHGYLAVHWSHDTKDWLGDATPESIVARATRGATRGSIVLLHDADHYAAEGCWRDTVAAIPRLVAALEARGLKTTTIR